MQIVQTDIVVVGAGMGGLVSAARALEHDVDVTVLEKGPRAGGSLSYAGGVIWTVESFEDVREYVPHGNPELQRIVVESLADGLSWLADLGVTFKDEIQEADLPGVGKEVNPADFIEHMVGLITDRGGDIRFQTSMLELVTDEEGGVAGVLAKERGRDRTLQIHAESVILATGGFQGNEELVSQYIVDDTETLWLRSNPWSTGDGFKAALDIGAKTTSGLDKFYGHNLVAPPAEFRPDEFRDASQYYGVLAIALNRRGDRFSDESESYFESTLAYDTATLADGRAYYVIDETIYETTGKVGHVGTKVERARDFGGRVADAASLRDLGDILDEWGVDGDSAIETIEEFNEAVRDGNGHELDPPRLDNQHAIDTPPFYVVEVQPGITFTMGGLDVNKNMAVLRRASSSSTLEHFPERMEDVFFEPIDGLYAAGVDVGNFDHRRYVGGLCLGLVSGRIAGENAANDALERKPYDGTGD